MISSRAVRFSERVQLGRTGLRITRIGLGTAPLGNLYDPVSDDEATAVVERAYDLGIRFFDTAPLYGYGIAERRLGAVLRQKPRDSYVLSTKVGRLLRSDRAPDPSQFFEGDPFYKATPPVAPLFDFSHDGALVSHRESLERLGLDGVDILHIHDPDHHHDQALTEAFPALAELRRQGVTGAVGAGMNQADMLARFAEQADFDCFLLAGRYTLLDQTALSTFLPLCEARSIPVIVGGVFNSGLLADPRPGARYDYVPASADMVERARKTQAVCAGHGVTLRAAAIRFPFGHPAVASVLIGCRTVQELNENVIACEEAIPEDLWSELKAENLLPAEVPTP